MTLLIMYAALAFTLTVLVGIPYQFFNRNDRPAWLCLLTGLVTVPAMILWSLMWFSDNHMPWGHPDPTLEERLRRDEIDADMADYVVNKVLWNRSAFPPVFWTDEESNWPADILRQNYERGIYPDIPEPEPEPLPLKAGEKIKTGKYKSAVGPQWPHYPDDAEPGDLLQPGEQFRLPDGSWFTASSPVSRRRVIEIIAGGVYSDEDPGGRDLAILREHVREQLRRRCHEYIVLGDGPEIEPVRDGNPDLEIRTGPLQERGGRGRARPADLPPFPGMGARKRV